MDELELTGTLSERAAQIISFAQAHNKSRADIGTVADMYKTAGVPFTESARRFIETYSGLLRDCELYRKAYSEINYAHNKRYKGYEKVDFECNIIGYSWTDDKQRAFADNVRDLNELWSDEMVDEASILSKQQGAVPIGTIGDYYPALVYIRDDGKLLAFHDFEDMKMHIFDSLEDFLAYEFTIDRLPPLLIIEK